MSNHKVDTTHHATPRMALVISVGLAVILGAPGIAVQASQAEPPAATAPAANTVVAAPGPALPGVGPTSLAPTTVNAFVAITQAVEAREQAARKRALAAERADRAKTRVARAQTLARKKAARVKARQARARMWVTPTASGIVTGSFGSSGSQWSSGSHTGADFDGNTGNTVRAVHTGVVIFAGSDGRYGNHVKIRHRNGDQTWYAHLSSISVKAGQQVLTGARLGGVGATGNASGSHLHFEVHIGGSKTATNPVPYLRGKGLRL